MARILNQRPSTYPLDLYESDADPAAVPPPLASRQRSPDRDSRPRIQPAVPANDSTISAADISDPASSDPNASKMVLPDFAAELEAALMNDLEAISSRWSAADRSPDGRLRLPVPAPLEIPTRPAKVETADSSALASAASDAPALDKAAFHDGLARDLQADRRAFERLLHRGRRPLEADVEARPVERDALPAGSAATAEPRQSRSYRPAPPRQAEPLPPEVAPRNEAPRIEPASPESASIADAANRSRINRGLVAVIAVTALVGIGGLATFQSVTARTEPTSGVPVAKDPTAPLAISAPNATIVKRSYDRAEPDETLAVATQIRGADAPTTPAVATPSAATVQLPVTEIQAADNAPPSDPPMPLAASSVPTGGEPAAAVTPPAAATDAAAPDPANAAVATAEIAPKAGSADNPLPTATVGTATIASSVKLRATPDNNAATLGVLNAGAKVQIVHCKGWCEILADGKHGYVFQKFLSGSAAAAKPFVQGARTSAQATKAVGLY